MPKLLFKATPKFRYHNSMDFGKVTDGMIIDVTAEQQERLLSDFPGNYSVFKKRVPQDAPTVEETVDKMISEDKAEPVTGKKPKGR